MEQVAGFLKDLYMLEAKVKDLKLPSDSSKVIFMYFEKKLFEKHNMNDSLYRESFKYFIDDIKGLTIIYEIIADSLSLEERLATAKKRDLDPDAYDDEE